MFTKSAAYYDALYRFKDYGAASEKIHGLVERLRPGAETLLDVGCGTGQHVAHLRGHYRTSGLDLNPDLLAIARTRCPEALFHQGDMASFALGRTFDVVTCLFSAIAYVKTLERMREAVACMASHLTPGGLVLVEPWFTPDTYWTGTITANFVDETDLKIAWMYTSERAGLVSVLDIHYLVGTKERVEQFTERHELGLFTHAEQMAAFADAGIDVTHEPHGFFGRGLYFGRKRTR